jgi:hypothetical protein
MNERHGYQVIAVTGVGGTKRVRVARDGGKKTNSKREYDCRAIPTAHRCAPIAWRRRPIGSRNGLRPRPNHGHSAEGTMGAGIKFLRAREDFTALGITARFFGPRMNFISK